MHFVYGWSMSRRTTSIPIFYLGPFVPIGFALYQAKFCFTVHNNPSILQFLAFLPKGLIDFQFPKDNLLKAVACAK